MVFNILFIQIHWHAHDVAAMYSASVIDSATTVYFLEDHETGPDPIEKTNSYMLSFLVKNPITVVPFKYLKIVLVANEWVFVGLDMNRLTRLTPYIKSGMVAVKYIRLSTTCLNWVAFALGLASFLENFVLGTIEFLTALQSIMPNWDKTFEHISFYT